MVLCSVFWFVSLFSVSFLVRSISIFFGCVYRCSCLLCMWLCYFSTLVWCWNYWFICYSTLYYCYSYVSIVVFFTWYLVDYLSLLFCYWLCLRSFWLINLLLFILFFKIQRSTRYALYRYMTLFLSIVRSVSALINYLVFRLYLGCLA